MSLVVCIRVVREACRSLFDGRSPEKSGDSGRERTMLLIQLVMLLTGALMIAAPRACTRKDARGNENAEKHTRTMGIWLFLAAVIWMVTAKLI